MNKVIKQRIDEHIRAGMPIAKAHFSADDLQCGCCDTVLDLDTEEYRPNFCPECGALLNWSWD